MPLFLHTSWWSVSTLFGGYFFSLHTRWWSPFICALLRIDLIAAGAFFSHKKDTLKNDLTATPLILLRLSLLLIRFQQIL